MSVIDLGVVTVGRGVTRPPNKAAAPIPRRPKPIRAIVVLVVLLATMGASAALAPGPLVAVGEVPFASNAHVLVQSHYAVVLDNDGRDRISVYDLAGGRRLWTEAAAGTAFNSDMTATADTIIATLPQARNQDSEVVAIDLLTGVTRWQRPGSWVELVPGGLLLATDTTESLVDPVDGTVAWMVDEAPSCAGTLDGRLLLDFCAETGAMTVRDVHTGRTVASRHLEALPVQGSTGAQVPAARLLYAGAITLIGFANGPNFDVTAYRTTDLSVIWSGLGRHPSDAALACGADICMGGAGDNEIVIDPTTGERLNHAPTRSEQGLSPNELLLVRTDVDYQTMRLGDVPPSDRPTPPGATAQTIDTVFGSIWIASPDGRNGIKLVQHLSHVETAACMSIADYVACPREPGVLTFWHRSLT
ncbi:MAG TPA: PQQ-binding-like beta-propeller repeat protein [Micromonosporaceae bacterium]|jgi:hypothetical protein